MALRLRREIELGEQTPMCLATAASLTTRVRAIVVLD